MIKITLTERREYYNKLSVFDFDGTLFRSPNKPQGYKRNWWGELISLSPPSVPLKGNGFWIDSTVDAAKKELSDRKTFCIMLTGRVDSVFDERIRDLIKFKGLNFDFVKLNPMGMDTGDFKTEEIRKILRKHPTIKKIEMWDDEQKKIDLYTDKFSSHYEFIANKLPDRE
jgi:hypothetical protein